MKIFSNYLTLDQLLSNNYFSSISFNDFQLVEFLVVSATENKFKVVYNGCQILTLEFENDEMDSQFSHYPSYWSEKFYSSIVGKKIRMKLSKYSVKTDSDMVFYTRYIIADVKVSGWKKYGLPPTHCVEFEFSKPQKLEATLTAFEWLSNNKYKLYFLQDNDLLYTDIITKEELMELLGTEFSYDIFKVLGYPADIIVDTFTYRLNGTIEKLENHVVSMELDDNYFDETETLLDYAE